MGEVQEEVKKVQEEQEKVQQEVGEVQEEVGEKKEEVDKVQFGGWDVRRRRSRGTSGWRREPC